MKEISMTIQKYPADLSRCGNATQCSVNKLLRSCTYTFLQMAHKILAWLCSNVPEGSFAFGCIKYKIRSTSTAKRQGTYTRIA